MSVISVDHTGNDTISPLRTGGFTMPAFFNKLLINQTIIYLMNCEEFNISQHSLFPHKKKPLRRGADRCVYTISSIVPGASR